MKPPYLVPPLSSLVVPADGPTVVSTFSGMGGSCLGFKMAGWRHLLACEFVEEARRTYARNFPGVQLAGENVRELTAEEILRRIGLARGQLDCFEGSPPCSSFSTAGKGAKGWGKAKKYSDDKMERTDDLFEEYIRLVRGLQPRSFVAENVSGMVKGASKGVFLDVLRDLKASGYRVRAQLLDAQWLGVPQGRQRVIFVGMREDLVDANGRPIEPEFPEPLKHRYSIREALADLVATPEELRETSIERFAIGAEWDKTPVGGASKKYFNLVKPDPDRPCPTITQTAGNLGAASVVHPLEKRKFTVRELKRLSGIPDDFVLTGTYQQQVERVGRCVPPPLMAAVAAKVRATLARAVR